MSASDAFPSTVAELPDIHPSGFCAADCRIYRYVIIGAEVRMGTQCVVWSFTTIGAHTQIGDRCILGSNCYVGHTSLLGDDVHLNHGVFLPNGSQVGNRVLFGPNVTCTDDKHSWVNNPAYHAEPPIIEDDVSIGAGATILPGVRLGQGCTIGAGAVVTKDVPPGETWVGVPATRLRRLPHFPQDGGWLWRQDPPPLKPPPPKIIRKGG